MLYIDKIFDNLFIEFVNGTMNLESARQSAFVNEPYM